ncbi:MAG: ABC transporter substrate-binding protein, partial [Chloroflexota bacterium]|nr:ABC transporter substrate-binding protein [Chloroflexota bacterium]
GAASALFAAGVPLGGRAGEQGVTPPAQLPEISSIPEHLKGSGEVVVVSYGGAFQDAQREAYFKPFEQLSGIKVIEAEGPDTAKVKAMVDTGNVEWDVAQFERFDVLNLAEQGDYWETMDYSLFDTANIDESHLHELAVDMLPYSWIIAYRTDVFAEAPQGWKDFWDTERFPGPRTMTAGSGGLSPNLEFALIADGVAPDELYPLDIERAFASLDRVREDVVKFWEAGAVPAQLLSDKEVALGVAWNGRIAAIQAQGAPVEVQWNEGMLSTDSWAVPKGAKNAENGRKFAAFITLPEPQARLSMLIPYGFVNTKAAELIPAERLAALPTAPDLLDKQFVRDVGWWAENNDDVAALWNEWILG